MYVQISSNTWVNDANIASITIDGLNISVSTTDGMTLTKQCHSKDELSAWLQQPFNIWSS